MKVQLIYDPIQPATVAYVDGVKTKSNDIYGFLYPVRFYLMQTWLYPDGSWTGLARQLYDLAKGEKIDFVFCGRQCDYVDIQKALENCENISVSYQKKDLIKDIEAWESNIKKLINGFSADIISNFFPKNKSLISNKSDASWLTRIDSEDAFEKAVSKKSRGCFCVTEAFLDSYPRLESLTQLTRGMKTPADSICCVFKSTKKLSAFKEYASMFPKLQFRFVLESDKNWKNSLYEKYGMPICMEQNYIYLRTEYKNSKNKILDFIDNQQSFDDEYTKLWEKKQDYGKLSPKEEKRISELQQQRNWIKKIKPNKDFMEFCKMVESSDLI